MSVGNFMMSSVKMILSVLAVCGAACSAGSPAGKTDSQENTMVKPSAFRIVESGEYGTAANSTAGQRGGEAAIEVARDEVTYGRMWQKHIGSGVRPAIDFSRETALFLVLGMQSSGGYGVSPSAVTVQAGTATVDAEIHAPGSGTIVATVMTAPFAVIAVSDRDVTRAVWRVKDKSEPFAQSMEPNP